MKEPVYQFFRKNNVAPLVGAWIERSDKCSLSGDIEVAPLVGAWIESCLFFLKVHTGVVAPLVGAWIERMHKCLPLSCLLRRSSCRSVD